MGGGCGVRPRSTCHDNRPLCRKAALICLVATGQLDGDVPSQRPLADPKPQLSGKGCTVEMTGMTYPRGR